MVSHSGKTFAKTTYRPVASQQICCPQESGCEPRAGKSDFSLSRGTHFPQDGCSRNLSHSIQKSYPTHLDTSCVAMSLNYEEKLLKFYVSHPIRTPRTTKRMKHLFSAVRIPQSNSFEVCLSLIG